MRESTMPSTGLSRRTVLGGAAGLGVAGLGIGAVTLPALAAPAKPKIYPASAWGAAKPSERLETLTYKPTYLVVHHTASANTSDTSQQHAFALARSIQAMHMRQGWGDSGQQFTISRGGYIMEARQGTLAALSTRKKFVRGIHAPGMNRRGIGIENEGMYTDSLPPKKQWDALVSLLAYLCWAYDIPTSRIIGHKDDKDSATRCPGEAFHAKLAKLRADVAKKLKGTPAVTPTPTRKPTATKKPTGTGKPTTKPTTGKPTGTKSPTGKPTATRSPTGKPTATRSPTGKPTATSSPTDRPTPTGTPRQTGGPRPTAHPTTDPTVEPTGQPTPAPTTAPPTSPPVTSTPTRSPAPTGSPRRQPPVEVPIPEPGHRVNPNEPPVAADGNEAAGETTARPVSAPDAKDPEHTGGLAATGSTRRGALRGLLDLLLD